jgi:hypothetical protein
VVAPGGEILDLVPARDKLVLEVRIQPIARNMGLLLVA